MPAFECTLSLIVIAAILDFGFGQTVSTTYGPLRGSRITVVGKQVDLFQGIPFAQPPVGRLRFLHPKPPKHWGPTPLDATRDTPSCLQSLELFTFPENYRQTPGNLSEDCLYLSIWRPSSALKGSNLSVMFYIYGGGWGMGSNKLPLYNGQVLAAENDVIVVSANYRVGPLGFGFLGSDTIPGNMGLLDQVAALEWVQSNIEFFGGDKNRVTIFGESAGAVSVGFHLLSPKSKNLFNNAILESGAPIQILDRHSFLTHETARSNLRLFAEILGCRGSDADIFFCLQGRNADEITPAFVKGLRQGVPHAPVIDHYFLIDAPLTLMKQMQYKRTNVLQGFNHDESELYLLPLLKNLTGPEARATYLKTVAPFTKLSKEPRKAEAMRLFYEDLLDPLVPTDYVQLLSDMRTDMDYRCRAVAFCGFYSVTNHAYMYSFNHRMSTSTYPAVVGVPHTYELDFVFGLPLLDHLNFTDEKQLSRKVMTYWTNFAKSGDPNEPVKQEAKWNMYEPVLMSYMEFTGRVSATRTRIRHQQCNFINNILPMIKEDCDLYPTPPPWSHFPTSSTTNHVTTPLLVIAAVLAMY